MGGDTYPEEFAKEIIETGVKGKWYLNELQDVKSELNDIKNTASGR